MIKYTNNIVSKAVLDEVANKFGIDTAQRLGILDDYALLSVYNYCVCENWHGEDEIFTDIEEIADLWGNDSLGLAKAVAYGSGEECFKPDNWLYFSAYGWIEAIKLSDRREFMLKRLLEFSEGDLHRALKDCGYLKE